jgi:hypothetical protein
VTLAVPAAIHLLQRGVDRGKHGVQVAAEAVDYGNDRKRNSGSDQSVFNGGRARLILPETEKRTRHVMLQWRVATRARPRSPDLPKFSRELFKVA